jgi:hypothetical protein
MKGRVAGTFRSLRSFNFRLWTAGALVSNIGTWMQRVAQDWLVLTQLTHQDASALGIVMSLQFAPQLLLLPWTGSAADPRWALGMGAGARFAAALVAVYVLAHRSHCLPSN